MRTALHSISYSGSWGQARLSLEETIVKAAELGFQGIMLASKRPHASALDMSEERRKEIKALLSKVGIGVACVAGYTNFTADSEHPDIPIREMQVQHVTELARLAAELGGDRVRIFTGYETAALSFTEQWSRCAEAVRECAQRAAQYGVIVGVQNHHDIACHFETLADFIAQVDHPNCKATFDAWTPALQGDDIVHAAKQMAPLMAFTIAADYVKRPRFRYNSALVNFERQSDLVAAVPMGEGFIPYEGFFNTLEEAGYDGWVGYEMCSPLRGGGSMENLDRCARKFLSFMGPWL